MQQTEQPQSVFSFGLNSDATFFATPTPARDTAEESATDVIPPPSATSDFLPAETIQGIQSGSAGATSVGTSEYHPFASSAQNGKRRRRAGAEVNGMSMKDVAEHMTLQIAAQPVDLPCPAGFNVTVYNGDISQHYTLASETVQITRGSIKYVDHHARYGPQTRFRFQLCHNYLQRKCAKLSECSYIHATVLPKPSEVHLNPFAPRRLAADRHGHGQDVPLSAQDDPSVADAYDTLPPGIIFTVYAPNAGTAGSFDINRAPQSIPSEMIIKTVGAETALAAIQSQKVSGEVRVTTGSRPRHCAHYQFKRLCNLGSQCHFIHSKVPFAEAEAQSAQTTNAALSAAAPPFPSNQQPPQPPSRIPNQQRGPSYGAPVSSGSSYPSSAMSAAPPQQQQQYHVSQGAHAMHPQAQQQQQQQLLNAGISAVALQQYLAAGAAADPNFLAGMQYAAQLLALQQHQPPQFAPPPMPYHQQAASMGGASHHHQHHQHPHAQQRYQNAPGNLVFPPAGGQLHPR